MRKQILVLAGLCLCTLFSVSVLHAEEIVAALPGVGTPEPTFTTACSGFGARTQNSPSAGGISWITDGLGCSGPRYPEGDYICVNATANSGYTFTGWSNGFNCPCAGTMGTGANNTCCFSMPAALVVCQANFQ